MASASNVDDTSAAKKTCDNSLDDVNDKKESLIQALDKNPASAVNFTQLLSCDACKSFARGPIRHCFVLHKICSLCDDEDPGNSTCPAEGCGEKLIVKAFNSELVETVRAMKLPVPCKNRKNGCLKKDEDIFMKNHEIECEFRFVYTYFGHKQIFKDLMNRVKEKAKEFNLETWKLFDERKDGMGCNLASRYYIEPDGHLFCICLDARNSGFVEASAFVIGGEHVANRYRVEMRLNSNDREVTHTHYGPVLSKDVKEPWNHEDAYTIPKKKFALFNKGFEFFGDHNRDKNGEITVPIMAKIIKKELNIPKED